MAVEARRAGRERETAGSAEGRSDGRATQAMSPSRLEPVLRSGDSSAQMMLFELKIELHGNLRQCSRQRRRRVAVYRWRLLDVGEMRGHRAMTTSCR